MNRELFIGAIDLSPYFSECKKIRGGLEIRLKAVPWDVWCEFWLYFERGYNGNGFLMPLYIKWHQHEYCFHIHKTYHLGEVWGRGKYCINFQTIIQREVYLQFDPIIPVVEA